MLFVIYSINITYFLYWYLPWALKYLEDVRVDERHQSPITTHLTIYTDWSLHLTHLMICGEAAMRKMKYVFS